MSVDSKVFNDAVHGCIEMHPLCVTVIDTPQFQRLRFIKQLGTGYFVYHSAAHNRFEHCIGVSHMAGQLARALKERQPELKITDKDVLCVQMAGLCHDLGHGPFSHLWEEFMKRARPQLRWKHERTSLAMLDYLISVNHLEGDLEKYGLDKSDVTFIKELIAKPETEHTDSTWPYKGRTPQKGFLYQIVANEENGVDVDKWDYILRDGHSLGVQVTFDYTRLVKSCRVIDVSPSDVPNLKICFRDKEVNNVFDMFQTRMMLHKKAYQHRVIKNLNTMLMDAFLLANDHITYKGVNGNELVLCDVPTDMSAMTYLNDDILHVIHRNNSNHEDMKRAKQIVHNMFTRRYYPHVGHTVPTSNDLQPSDLVNQMMRNLPFNSGLTKDDLDVQLVTLNYGNGRFNPISNVGFFSKEEPQIYREHKPNEVSMMFPSQWEEKIFRVVCRKYDEELVSEAKIAFTRTCEDFEVAIHNTNPSNEISCTNNVSLRVLSLPVNAVLNGKDEKTIRNNKKREMIEEEVKCKRMKS